MTPAARKQFKEASAILHNFMYQEHMFGRESKFIAELYTLQGYKYDSAYNRMAQRSAAYTYVYLKKYTPHDAGDVALFSIIKEQAGL